MCRVVLARLCVCGDGGAGLGGYVSARLMDRAAAPLCTTQDVPTPTLHPHLHTTGEAMPMIEHLKLERQANYFGHAAPFHCFSGEYSKGGRSYKVSVVTNGKDRTYGCDNVRACACVQGGWGGPGAGSCPHLNLSHVASFASSLTPRRWARCRRRWRPTWRSR